MTVQFEYKQANCFYEKEGCGFPVILLHGFCENAKMWRALSDRLKDSCLVIAPDLPGYGNSDYVKISSIDNYANYVQAIIEREKIEKFIVIGHSMGGYIGANLLSHTNKNSIGFGLINSHVYEDTQEKKLNRARSIEFIEKHPASHFVKELIYHLFHPDFVTKNKTLVDGLVADASTLYNETLVDSSLAMMNRKQEESFLKEYLHPIFFAIGEDDTSIAADKVLTQALNAQIAQIQYNKSCGHMSLQEKKAETIENVVHFIKNCLLIEQN